MRIKTFFMMTVACALMLHAEPVAVILDSPSPLQPDIQRAMIHEVEAAFRDTGYLFQWIAKQDRKRDDVYGDLVVVQLRGQCTADFSKPSAAPKSRAIGWAHRASDGSIMPFAEIDCDRVQHMTRVLLMGETKADRSVYFGRAIGRILSHELYHILSGNSGHGYTGLAQARFSSSELVNGTLAFSSREVQMLSRKLLASRTSPDDLSAGSEESTDVGR